MVEQISAADRSSLQAERGPVNMAVAGAMVFAPGEGSGYEQVEQRLRERLHLVPRYRQRLEQPPLGLANPVWVDDAAFDLHWHLRSASLPAPGGPRELSAYVAREMSRKLDRSRPLWELHVIDGYEGYRRVVLPKMHHALVDGLAAIGVGMVLLDPTPDPLPIEPPAGDWEPRAYDRRRHFAQIATNPLAQAQRIVVDSALRALDTSPRRAAEDLRRAVDLATELARQRPQAPMTPLNEPLSPNRRFAIHRCALSDVKAAGGRLGGTVNDVLLAAVTGMLERYFRVAGVDLGGRSPVALVPVSIRREDEQDAMTNRISMVFVDLPVDESSPAGRVARISATMRELRASAAVRAGALIAGVSGQAPPLLAGMLVRAMGNVRGMNLVVSNIPGPQQPFYLCGTRLEEVYPAVPLNPGNQRLSMGIISYDGGVCFGLMADAKLDPGVDAVADALRAALEDVLAA